MQSGNCMNIQTASAQRTSKHSRHLLRTFAEIINSLRSDSMISAHNADFRSCRSSNACADCLKCSHNFSPADFRNRLSKTQRASDVILQHCSVIIYAPELYDKSVPAELHPFSAYLGKGRNRTQPCEMFTLTLFVTYILQYL